MKHQRKSRKRPCRICRKWFSPDPRVGDRQQTCGSKKCQDKWHAKKCAAWNKKNPAYFREIYLARKLSAVNEATVTDNTHSPKSNGSEKVFSAHLSAQPSQLPRNLIQEVIGAQHLVIIEYVARLLFGPFQEVMQRQLIRITSELEQLPREVISRGDSMQRGP